jgi:hypothetical protein
VGNGPVPTTPPHRTSPSCQRIHASHALGPMRPTLRDTGNTVIGPFVRHKVSALAKVSLWDFSRRASFRLGWLIITCTNASAFSPWLWSLHHKPRPRREVKALSNGDLRPARTPSRSRDHGGVQPDESP